MGCSLITDAGIKHLAKLINLESLNLYLTYITYTGLKYLARLENLKSLDLSSCNNIEVSMRKQYDSRNEIIDLFK